MEAGEQPNPDRDTGVPHVIRPAKEKSPGHEPPANVSGPKNSGRQRANGLAGNQQRTSPPQTGDTKDYRDVTQVQQVGSPRIGCRPAATQGSTAIPPIAIRERR